MKSPPCTHYTHTGNTCQCVAYPYAEKPNFGGAFCAAEPHSRRAGAGRGINPRAPTPARSTLARLSGTKIAPHGERSYRAGACPCEHGAGAGRVLSISPERHRHGARVSFVRLLVLRRLADFVIIIFVNTVCYFVGAGTIDKKHL